MPVQTGAYGAGELEYILEHDGTVLAEVQDVQWDFDPKLEAFGRGLGDLKNKYYKQTDAAAGSWKIKRNMLMRSDKGMLFSDLVSGAQYVIQEAIAASSATYTPTLTAYVSILEIRLLTSNTILREFVDFSVNYSTGVITFQASTPEAAVLKYVVNNRRNKNYLIDGSFEDSISNIWTTFATGAVARDSSNAYADGGSWALKITPSAQNDGARYNIPMYLQPGRTYRIRGMAKAAAAEVLAWFFNDGSSDVACTPVSGATLSTTYTAFEATFVATKSTIPSILVKDSKSSPGVLYIDNLAILDDTTGNNPTLLPDPMSAGLAVPMTFNILVRRKIDGIVVERLMACTVNKLSKKSGKPYTEDIEGMFLHYISE